METYFDSRIDLLQRSLAKHSDKLKMKADQAFHDMLKRRQIRSPSTDNLAENLDREMQKFKMKVRPVCYLATQCIA
jgi:ribosome-associated translation inhibitor RaiA